MGQPFETWLELEATYHFAFNGRQEMFNASFENANARRVATQALDAAVKDARGGGLKGHGGDRRSEDEEKPSLQRKLETHGNSADYLTARIARDHPEVLERMKVGEFRSVRQAAIAAGIVKVTTALERAGQESLDTLAM